MGLYVSFSITADWGYPEEVEGGDENIGYESVPVDYSEACEAFVSTFLDTALSLVPVDTGYLKSTINANADGDTCEAEATADYAQYVEYGTVYMDAQPYFEPALEAACAAAAEAAEEALQEAQEELADLLEDMQADSDTGAMMMGGGGGGGLMNFMASFLAILLVSAVSAIISSIFDTTKSSISRSAFVPDIEIT